MTKDIDWNKVPILQEPHQRIRARARINALEEAAKWAASFVPAEHNQMSKRERATVLATREGIAADIRALKGQEK